MAWLIYMLPPLALILLWPILAFRAGRRSRGMPSIATETSAPGRDVWRSALAGAACALALVAAAYALADQTILAQPGLGLLLLAEAATAGMLALFPVHDHWTRLRGHAAVVAAVAWLYIAPVMFFLSIIATACACASTGPTYVPPTLLGLLGTRAWIDLAIIGNPVLLILAAMLPSDRLPAPASA